MRETGTKQSLAERLDAQMKLKGPITKGGGASKQSV